MCNNKILTVILLCMATLCVQADKHDLYYFTHPAQTQQFNRIVHELRCVVCQNQTLAESQAPLAVDLRSEIYQQVRAGKNDDQIIDYLKVRYGDFIVYTPPMKPSTYLLWFAPLLLLIIGSLILIGIKKRHSMTQREQSS
jgi:cytochrome c-type biogenesis protein CcmH